MLLAIDPGADAGWALFNDAGRLASCGLSADDDKSGAPSGLPLARVLIECPKLRPWGEKNPNAILTLARRAGEWGGYYYDHLVEYLTPNDWKGTTKKEIDHARTWSRLDATEQGIVDRFFKAAPGRNGLAPSRRHNVLDAIGLGLFGVGRSSRNLPARVSA